MIEAAVLDLGQVVITCQIEKIPIHLAKTCGADPAHVCNILKTDTTFHRLERGEMTMEEYHKHITGLIGKSISIDDFLAGWNCFYDGLMPGVSKMLRQLQKKVRLVALTNTNAGHAVVWKKLFADTLDNFERVFCSHEIAARKPEPQAYQIALDYLDIKNENIVFIDDRLDNVTAAEKMGMQGIVASDTASTVKKLRNLGVI